MYTGKIGQGNARFIQFSSACYHRRVASGVQSIFFQCRRQHTHAQRLTKDKYIANLCIRVAFDFGGMHQAHHHQSVNWLYRIDRVSTRDRDSRFGANRFTTLDNLADGLDRQLVDGHPHQCQSHNRRTAHCIDIRYGIGRRDAPKVIGIINNGHEEVSSRY